ncbi:MAG: hypothetical protein ACTHK4_00605 [Mycobacteriales bacterium]
MHAESAVVPMPTGARQAIEVADRLGRSFDGLLARTAVYRCVCSSQRALIAAGMAPTTDSVELLARTAIEQRLDVVIVRGHG